MAECRGIRNKTRKRTVKQMAKALPFAPKDKFDHEILVLQGGGALGAYQAGVYEGLAEAGHMPTWVVGISIGAINSAIIAGNPPERRVERLREFWRRIAVDVGPALPEWLDSMRPLVNYAAAMSAVAFGIPPFFTPRMPRPWFVKNGADTGLSVYDTSPLIETLNELVDFDLINTGQPRLSLGAVDIRKGTSVYFDSDSTVIGPDHVRASGALPPGFPPVKIEGEWYWDGGVVSNSPITYVGQQKPMWTARIVQVDTFDAAGDMPRNLRDVMERAKDIQYASRSRLNLEQIREVGEIRAASRRLVDKLPARLKSNPDAQRLAAASEEIGWIVIRISNQRPSRSGVVKDYEFSRATVSEAWAAGLADVRSSISGWKKVPAKRAAGVVIYRPTEALPTPKRLPTRTKLKALPAPRLAAMRRKMKSHALRS
jgi:NTE family protein